jgi:hypothetical protein
MVGKGWEGQVQILPITNNAFKHSFCVFFFFFLIRQRKGVLNY